MKASQSATDPRDEVAQDTNRANQLNPFHEAFWKSRQIQPGKVEMVYHGTSKENADAILKKLSLVDVLQLLCWGRCSLIFHEFP